MIVFFGRASPVLLFAGLKPGTSRSIREQDNRKFASFDAATDTELAKRFGWFHKSSLL